MPHILRTFKVFIVKKFRNTRILFDEKFSCKEGKKYGIEDHIQSSVLEVYFAFHLPKVRIRLGSVYLIMNETLNLDVNLKYYDQSLVKQPER